MLASEMDGKNLGRACLQKAIKQLLALLTSGFGTSAFLRVVKIFLMAGMAVRSSDSFLPWLLLPVSAEGHLDRISLEYNTYSYDIYIYIYCRHTVFWIIYDYNISKE